MKSRFVLAPAGRERLFIACWPEPALREAIAMLLAAGGPLPGVPTRRDDWHMTIAFLGDCDPQRSASIVRLLRELPWPPIRLELARFGVFDAARVLWLGSSATPEALERARLRLIDDLARLDIEVADAERFTAHITLARKFAGAAARAAPVPALRWLLPRPVLARSRGATGGTRYARFDSA